MLFFRQKQAPEPPPTGATWVDIMYVTHVLLELALGVIKLRGRYSHEAPGSRLEPGQMYVRHHGFSILSMTLLSYLVWSHGLADTPMGRQASGALALFHGGAVGAFAIAWHKGAIKLRKLFIPHMPHAIAFAMHALM